MKSRLRQLKRFLELRTGYEVRKVSGPGNPLGFLFSRIDTVVDIGANTGQFAREARRLFPSAMIYSFEPIHSCYTQLVKSFRNDTLFNGFNFALGSRDEQRDMHVSIYSPSSSLLTMQKLHQDAFPHTLESHTESIGVRTLDSFHQDIPLTGSTLIKMDVQGYEHEVIAGGHIAFSRALAVISEVSFAQLYEGQSLFSDIEALLTKHGLRYAGSLAQKADPRDGRILIQDALFLRNSESEERERL